MKNMHNQNRRPVSGKSGEGRFPSSLEGRLAAYAAMGVSMMAAGTAAATPQYTRLAAPMTTLTPGGEAFINYGGKAAFLGMMTSLNRVNGDASVTFSGMTPGIDTVTVAPSANGGATSNLEFLTKGTEVGGTGNTFVFGNGGYNSTNVVNAGNHEILYTGLRASSNGKDFYGWPLFRLIPPQSLSPIWWTLIASCLALHLNRLPTHLLRWAIPAEPL